MLMIGAHGTGDNRIRNPVPAAWRAVDARTGGATPRRPGIGPAQHNVCGAAQRARSPWSL